MSKHNPAITAKAAAKERRKRRNAKRKATWQGEFHKADLKKISLMKRALMSFKNFFGKGQQGGTYVFIHVSKYPGQRKGITRTNTAKRMAQKFRRDIKQYKKAERAKGRA